MFQVILFAWRSEEITFALINFHIFSFSLFFLSHSLNACADLREKVIIVCEQNVVLQYKRHTYKYQTYIKPMHDVGESAKCSLYKGFQWPKWSKNLLPTSICCYFHVVIKWMSKKIFFGSRFKCAHLSLEVGYACMKYALKLVRSFNFLLFPTPILTIQIYPFITIFYLHLCVNNCKATYYGL